MLDIRLDFINNIDEGAIQKMIEIRRMFIALDDVIKIQGEKCEESKLAAGTRAASLARTNLEIALQYSIKALCILGERTNESTA